MNWIAFVTIAVISDSSRIFIDNYVSDFYFKGNGAVSQKLFYAYTSIIFSVILAIVGDIDFSNFPITTFFVFLLSGILSSIASIPYYKALEIDNSTNLGIFIQLAPILYLILGWLFLGDSLSFTQFIAFFVILAAPLLIILTTHKRSRKIRLKAILYSFLYVLIAVIANLIFVKENTTDINFLTGISFILLGKGIGAFLIFLIRPKWRRRFHQVSKTTKRKVFRPLIVNAIIGLIKDIAYRGALITAPSIALASVATDSTEPIAIFFMGLVLTIIWPKFGREKLDKKTVLVHVIATALVVTGIILIQI